MRGLLGTFLAMVPFLSCSFAAKVKIYIMAGQSNMVGFASVDHLRQLVTTKAAEYSRFVNLTTKQFRVLPEVRIADKNSGSIKISALHVGMNFNVTKFGPEVGFGWTMQGQASGEPILILKCAVASTSLAYNWRPPSAPTTLPDGTVISQMYGERYREMVSMVKNALNNLEQYVPGHSSQGYELAGFLWLQGWFDAFVDPMRAAYAENLACLIEDVRWAFDAPNMPFLIGELGQGGRPIVADPQTTAYVREMRNIQRTVAASFDDNVVFVPTSNYVVNGAEEFDGIHHYYGRADTMIQIGISFGRELLKLPPIPAVRRSRRWKNDGQTRQGGGGGRN